MKKTLSIILAIVIVIGAYVWSSYNSLVTLNINADAQWKQVETQYQRRFDLIPNLVESAKGVMKQEQSVFNAIAEARTQYSGATTADAKVAAANQVEGALGRLLVITENYPELKSAGTVQALMTQLEGTENRVSVERSRFNETIKGYNLKIMKFPSSIMASLFGFDERHYFDATPGAETAPAVKF
ncbi:MAG: LemA family protein [Candidatus Paceibacterota bacterium]|jgi:LemA protein